MGETQSKENISVAKSFKPLWIGLGVGAGALVSLAAAPFVIAGIGFGAGGIAAGSLAAAWMSASGPVAAGSLIAILQSIGAAGMGAASTGIAAAIGGAVGGGIATGVTVAAMKISTSKEHRASTYKSRAEELKVYFQDISSNDWLIVDYYCTLRKIIPIEGRLYVTTNFFCFYSNTDSTETSKVIKLRDIIDITEEFEKLSTLTCPVAIHISTKTEKYIFTAFEAPHETYELLVSFWQKAITGKMSSPTELIQLIISLYGENLGFSNTEEVMAYFLPPQI